MGYISGGRLGSFGGVWGSDLTQSGFSQVNQLWLSPCQTAYYLIYI